MKRLVFGAITALIIITSSAARADKPSGGTVYGVAFYNLENLFDTINNNGKFDLEFSPQGARQWDSAKYRLKINNLANAIANLVTESTPGGPAIVGIAEVENESVVRDLVEAEPLRSRRLGYVHHDSPDLRGIDVALLYDSTLFTLISYEPHFLYIPDNPEFRTRDQLCVTGLLGRDTLSVIVNHWPSRLGGQELSEPMRIAAAELTRHIADSLWACDPERAIIVMGDLNDDPADASCTRVLGGREDPYDVAPHSFLNPWIKIHASGRGTLTYRGQWNLFDQIVVGGTLLPDNGASSLIYTGARIMDLDFIKQHGGRYDGMPWRTYAGGRFLEGYSDHFPTEIFLFAPRGQCQPALNNSHK